MSSVSRCRSCGAEVVWVQTPSGRHMTIDPEPVENGNVVKDSDHPNRAHVLRNGENPTGARYVSHFATCPDASVWRRHNHSK